MTFPGVKKFTGNLHTFFIPEKYRSDEETFRKCKVFINTTLITTIFAIFFLGNAVLFHMPMATIAMICCSVLFFSFAWMLRAGVPFRVCTNAYIALGVIATAWDTYWAGGLNSIHTPWFVFPAIGTLLIGTIRESRFWLVVSLAILGAFGVGALRGYPFPNELGPDYYSWMQLSAYAGLIVILFIVVLVVENAYQKSLHRREAALESLRKSQVQLIHQEKMASLGQLIAGIAHEIQNPLNFVNNFSFVSKDMLDDLREAKTEEERNDLIRLLSENLDRIEQHGKRADGIVKRMLMHSRTQPGERQETDINRLCDEAIALAFQNARVNNPDFKSAIEKNYSEQPVVVNAVPQEISRVILNLLDNAFYSVNRKRMEKAAAGEAYQPSVSVTTAAGNKSVSFAIRDNGDGVAPGILGNIFQPFFTTKPAKEGTGLGLSICYDIVKAHGGEIRAESTEHEGTTMTVTLVM
ncbi:MAG TPA: HAMP domain-containing sensor histidine kinase [Bacteroidia bacterium]|nr:HAMP domain-containing sensor histidine kinase [Bacteroidia bacterium]